MEGEIEKRKQAGRKEALTVESIIMHSPMMLLCFANEAGVTIEKHIIHGFVMILIAVVYTLILTKALPRPVCKEE